MRQTTNKPAYFVLRNTLKGLLWTVLGGLVTAWVILLLGMVYESLAVSRFGMIGLVMGLAEIISMIFLITGYAILVTVVFVLPAMLLPFSISTWALTVWIYKDSRVDRTGAQIKGALLGGLAGVATIFVRTSLLPMPFFTHYIFNSDAGVKTFWVIIYALPIIGAITSGYFGKILASKLET